MADPQSSSRSNTASVVPMKRPFDDGHAPSVSSPLNPDAAARRGATVRTTAPGGREQREKKESLKKRESSGGISPSTNEPLIKKSKIADETPTAPSPVRYNHALPRDAFHYTVRGSAFSSHEPEPLYTPEGVELKKPLDHAENKKNFHYNHCIADPSFKHSRYYRQTDSKPYLPRMSFEDSDKWFHFDESANIVTNEKGWRMGRGNVFVREGSFYYEVKILQGVPRDGPPVSTSYTPAAGPLPHVRMGFARREAPLDTPVGFDGYSYGLTDIRMEPMHKSRGHKYLDDGSERSTTTSSTTLTKKLGKGKGKSRSTKEAAPLVNFSADDHAREGDVIGLEITLPSISLHSKVVEGTYNPAIDVSPGFVGPDTDEKEAALNIVRDRFPVPYKGSMYFESIEYRASKGMEAYGDRGPFAKETPSANHTDPTVRCLPHSSIKIWKNGKRIGTAFRNLMAFLPPASIPGSDKTVRSGLDDGMLGYYPAIGVFSGGMAEVNFGPDFWFPPPHLDMGCSSSSGRAPTSSASTPSPTTSLTPGIAQAGNTKAGTSKAAAAAIGAKEVGGSEIQIQIKSEKDENEGIVAGAGAEEGGGGKRNSINAMIIDKPPSHSSSLSPSSLMTTPRVPPLRPISERYVEHIAEDIMYDIIDEVDFYVQDGLRLGFED